MNACKLSVTSKAHNSHSKNNTHRKKRCPQVKFHAPWLAEMGFTPSALVQALPEPGGMTFILCNENIQKYSALDKATKEKNGKLIQVSEVTHRLMTAPYLGIAGQIVFNTGLIIGDPLLARYEYGLIKVRKLPDNVLFIPGDRKRKDSRAAEPERKVWLVGKWLAEYGFAYDAWVTAAAVPGGITFRLYDGDKKDYGALVKYARKNKLKLYQVKKRDRTCYIVAAGHCVERAGFNAGDAFIATCGYGVIHVTKPDFAYLGLL